MERYIFNAGVHGVTVLERGGGWFLMLGNKENVRSLLDYIGTAMDIGEWEDEDSVSLAMSIGETREEEQEKEAPCECSQCRREEWS